jgi:hypothetical protein
MCFCKGHANAPIILAALAALLAAGVFTPAAATEFEASTVPAGHYLLKIYPKFYYTSAYFSPGGRALNMEEVSGLLYFELPVHLQYGVTNSFAVGAIIPFGWTYEEEENRDQSVDRVTVREAWVTLKYRLLTIPLVVSPALHVKVPLAEKKAWEDGLRIGDGQVDLHPLCHLEYYSKTRYWYVQLSGGYKYRFKKEDIKPFDELTFYGRAGYELFPDLRMRFYLYTDLTEFMNGDYPGEDLEFYEMEGTLHEFGYGVSLWPRPTFRVDITTGGDWSGSNRYRGMHWMLGFSKLF